MCWTIKSTFLISCGIPAKGNNSEKLKDAIEANGKICNKKIKIFSIFSRFFWLSCHLWTQFSQFLKGQFGKLLCLSHREFPEVFETPPTFNSSPFQSGVIAKIPLKSVFFGTPCIFWMEIRYFKSCVLLLACYYCLLHQICSTQQSHNLVSSWPNSSGSSRRNVLNTPYVPIKWSDEYVA